MHSCKLFGTTGLAGGFLYNKKRREHKVSALRLKQPSKIQKSVCTQMTNNFGSDLKRINR